MNEILTNEIQIEVLSKELKNITEQYNKMLLHIYPNQEYIFRFSLCKNRAEQNMPYHIKTLVEQYCNCRVDVKLKTNIIVKTRQYLIFCLKHLTRLSLKNIGLKCNGLDHSSVLHNIGQFKDKYSVEEDYRTDFLNLMEFMEESGIDVKNLDHEIKEIEIIK